MKLTIFYFTLLFSFGYQGIPDEINDYIEQLRDAIPEPLIEGKTLNVELSDNKYITGLINATDISLKGLKDFDMNITYVLNLVPTYYVLTVDPIVVDLNYLADLDLLNSSFLQVYGNGTGRVQLNNFTVQGNIVFSLVPLNLTLNGMQMHLDESKFTFDGILDDETFSKEFGDFLGSTVLNIFNENEHTLSTVVEDAINTFVAEILSKNSTLLSEPHNDEDKNNVMAKDEIGFYSSEDVIENMGEILFEVLASLIQTYTGEN